MPGTGSWGADELIAFAFDNKPQDINRWRNESYWRERFGDGVVRQRFLWTEFDEAVAEKLLDFRTDGTPLIEDIDQIATKVTGLSYLQDKFADGTTGPRQGICPFTAMGTFNRRCCRPLTFEDLHREYMGLDRPHDEALTRTPNWSSYNSALRC